MKRKWLPPPLASTGPPPQLGLPRWLSGKKNMPDNAGAAGDRILIFGLGRSPGGGNCSLLQYSCLGNPMDRSAWQAIVQGVTESGTTEQLSTHCPPPQYYFPPEQPQKRALLSFTAASGQAHADRADLNLVANAWFQQWEFSPLLIHKLLTLPS